MCPSVGDSNLLVLPCHLERNTETKKQQKQEPSTCLSPWEGALVRFIAWLLVTVTVGLYEERPSFSFNPSASRYRLSSDLQTSLLVYRAKYFQTQNLELWISLQNLSRQKPSAAHELSHQLLQATEEREINGVKWRVTQPGHPNVVSGS